MPPMKWEIARLITTLAQECEAYGVEIRTNTEATARMIADMKPNWVILATGSKPVVPAFREWIVKMLLKRLTSWKEDPKKKSLATQ